MEVRRRERVGKATRIALERTGGEEKPSEAGRHCLIDRPKVANRDYQEKIAHQDVCMSCLILVLEYQAAGEVIWLATRETAGAATAGAST